MNEKNELAARLADALGAVDAVIADARRAGLAALSLEDAAAFRTAEKSLRDAALVLATMANAVDVEKTGLGFPGDELLGDEPAEQGQAARLWSFALESDDARPVAVFGTAELWADCRPSGRKLGDGRDVLACGSVANPAGYCCEHGVFVREQPQMTAPADAPATKPYSYRAQKFGERKYGIVATLPGVSGWMPIPVGYFRRLRDADALAALLEAEYYRTGQTTDATVETFRRSIGDVR